MTKRVIEARGRKIALIEAGAGDPLVYLHGFADVHAAVASGAAEIGVLPIENVVNGTVRETLDLLRDGALQIVGESVVPVHLVVAALPGVALADVRRIYSHAQALAQAEAFLKARDWTLLTTYNTAGAGAMIRERQERDAAALLSPRAAELPLLRYYANSIAHLLPR